MGYLSGSGNMKLKVKQWSERPRILMLMLAVTVPALALIAFALYHLYTIQHDKAIEAAYQRDYQRFLAVAEKQIDERAYEVAEEASSKFPDADSSDQLDSFIATHPDIAHAILWVGKNNFEFRSQSDRMMRDRQFCSESQTLSSEFRGWWDMEAKDFVAEIKKMEATTGRRVLFMEHPVTRGEKMQYQTLVMFVPRGSTPEHPALAGFIYDTEYLKNKFFPQALNDVLPDQMENDTSHPRKGIMVRYEKDEYPLATSMYWDG